MKTRAEWVKALIRDCSEVWKDTSLMLDTTTQYSDHTEILQLHYIEHFGWYVTSVLLVDATGHAQARTTPLGHHPSQEIQKATLKFFMESCCFVALTFPAPNKSFPEWMNGKHWSSMGDNTQVRISDWRELERKAMASEKRKETLFQSLTKGQEPNKKKKEDVEPINLLTEASSSQQEPKNKDVKPTREPADRTILAFLKELNS